MVSSVKKVECCILWFDQARLAAVPNLREWPAYEPTQRVTMNLDIESHIVEDPDGDERRLWEEVQY